MSTQLFSITIITLCAWCLHINKTRCLRCGSTSVFILSHLCLPSLTTLKKLAFCLNGRGEERIKKKKIVLGLWAYFSLDEQLMMCGDYNWLSWPLCSFLEAVGTLKGLFIHYAINLSTIKTTVLSVTEKHALNLTLWHMSTGNTHTQIHITWHLNVLINMDRMVSWNQSH